MIAFATVYIDNFHSIAEKWDCPHLECRGHIIDLVKRGLLLCKDSEMPNRAIASVALWAAAVVSLLGFFSHAFLGGPLFVHPLMADTDLPIAVTWLGLVSWHVVSIVLMSFAIAFGYTAKNPGNAALALFASAMSASVSLLCIAVGIRGNAVLFTLPAPYLFGFIALLGIVGVFGRRRRL